MVEWTAIAAYHVLAAFLQFFVGFLIVVRRPRIEWAFVLGALFVFNGAISVISLLIALGWLPAFSYGPPEGTGRIYFVFDRATTFLILYLALAYPRRPALANRWPLVLPIFFSLAIAFAWSIVAFQIPLFRPYPDHITPPLCGDTPCQISTWPARIVWDFLSFGFIVILWRWTTLLPQTRSPLELAQFKLLFAAFAMRAVNVLLLYNVENIPALITRDWSLLSVSPWLLFPSVFALAAFASIAYATIQLLRHRSRHGTQMRKAIDLVLLFMLLGAVEYLLAVGLDNYGKAGFATVVVLTPFLNLDVQVIRPALVLLAMVRFNLFGTSIQYESKAASLIVGLFVFAAFLQAFLNGTTFLDGTARLAFAVFAASLIAVPATFLSQRYLQPVAQAGMVGNVPTYVASLEDAYRNGQPGRLSRISLEALRERCGVSEEQGEALEEAVRTRWATQSRRNWRPGDIILGRYEILRMLGEGSNGQAFHAKDILLVADVVLKRTRHLEAAAQKILLQEGYALARLNHPNVVRLLRSEVVGEEPVLVLEYLRGGSLANRLATGGPMDEMQAKAVVSDVLAGLQAAHGVGLVHRDLKPSNVLFDDDGHAKVSDFGLARPITPSIHLGDPTASSPGPTGTLRYMAPEQVQGLPASERTDIHAVGLLYYECLTGQAALPPGLSDFAMRRHIVEGPPAPLDATWNDRARSALARALQRDPAQRFASASEFAAAL